MSVDETLMCSFQILKPSEKKAKYQYGGTQRPITPPRGGPVPAVGKKKWSLWETRGCAAPLILLTFLSNSPLPSFPGWVLYVICKWYNSFRFFEKPPVCILHSSRRGISFLAWFNCRSRRGASGVGYVVEMQLLFFNRRMRCDYGNDAKRILLLRLHIHVGIFTFLFEIMSVW